MEFFEEEAQALHQPNNDALVITLIIGNVKIHWVLVDGGSSTDVLTLEVFNKMRLDSGQLINCATSLVGFGAEKVELEGSIKLPVTFGEDPRTIVKMVNFLVVNCLSSYNVILGRPTFTRAESNSVNLPLGHEVPNTERNMRKLVKESKPQKFKFREGIQDNKDQRDHDVDVTRVGGEVKMMGWCSTSRPRPRLPA